MTGAQKTEQPRANGSVQNIRRMRPYTSMLQPLLKCLLFLFHPTILQKEQWNGFSRVSGGTHTPVFLVELTKRNGEKSTTNETRAAACS